MPLIYAEGCDPVKWQLSGVKTAGAEVLWDDKDFYVASSSSAFKVGLQRLMCRAQVLQQAEEIGAVSLEPSAPTLIVMGSFDSDQTHFQMSERAGFIDDNELNILEAYAVWFKEFVCPKPHARIISDNASFPDVVETCRRQMFLDEGASVLVLQDGGTPEDQVAAFVAILTDPSVLTPVRCGVPVSTTPKTPRAIDVGPGPLRPAPMPPFNP